MLKKIPGNVQEDSGECLKRFRGCSKRFRGIFEEIPGNVHEESWEYSRGFRGMLKKAPRTVSKDSREYLKRLNAL